MSYFADSTNDRGAGVTWFHEHGHLIDNATGCMSNDAQFNALLKKDVYNYRLNFGKANNLKTFDKVDSAISQELSSMRKHSGVSDLREGLTQGNIHGVAGHDLSYWSNSQAVSSEAFAHMFEAQFDVIRYSEMKKYFPESLMYFEKKIKEVVV